MQRLFLSKQAMNGHEWGEVEEHNRLYICAYFPNSGGTRGFYSEHEGLEDFCSPLKTYY